VVLRQLYPAPFCMERLCSWPSMDLRAANPNLHSPERPLIGRLVPTQSTGRRRDRFLHVINPIADARRLILSLLV